MRSKGEQGPRALPLLKGLLGVRNLNKRLLNKLLLTLQPPTKRAIQTHQDISVGNGNSFGLHLNLICLDDLIRYQTPPITGCVRPSLIGKYQEKEVMSTFTYILCFDFFLSLSMIRTPTTTRLKMPQCPQHGKIMSVHLANTLDKANIFHEKA